MEFSVHWCKLDAITIEKSTVNNELNKEIQHTGKGSSLV